MLRGIIDTHAHYDDPAFDEDREELLDSLAAEGIAAVIDVQAAPGDGERILALAHSRPWIFAAAGVHPDEAGEMDGEILREIARTAEDGKVVAVGEIGLDYHVWNKEGSRSPEEKETQRFWFRQQMALARDLRLPVIIHSREACEDTLRILREEFDPSCGGVMHCYAYSAETAAELAKLGLHFGIGGVVTYKNGRRLAETVAAVPEDRLLLETDCPYLSPEPFRGRRNSSLRLAEVVKRIAEIRGMTEAEVIGLTSRNAERLFRFSEHGGYGGNLPGNR